MEKDPEAEGEKMETISVEEKEAEKSPKTEKIEGPGNTEDA